MVDNPTSTETTTPIKLNTATQVIGLAVTVLGIVISAYLTISSDKKKSLSIFYTTSRPLISQEASKTDGIDIRIKGNTISNPWIFTGRIENSGSIPIEGRDIEAPISIHFAGTKIVAADISGIVPTSMAVESDFTTDRLTIKHGLINPGDKYEFNAILDSEPKSIHTSFRISGIASPIEMWPTANSKQKLFYFNMPKKVEYVSMVGITMCALLMVLVCIVGTQAVISNTKKNENDAKGIITLIVVITITIPLTLISVGGWSILAQ